MRLGSRRRNAITDVNITPIVDVMLMLLVIFILTAPVIRYGLDIGLPKGTFGEENTRHAVIVSLGRGGGIFVQDRSVEMADLVGVLEEELLTGPASKVMIAADKSISYGRVMGILSLIKTAGIDNVYLLTEPDKGE
ncbi:MAG: biopolymer transporter ExbD [Candidatus Coatesbacteria bacterium]|nr:biopolymer transporter ExbD [Candidatus Coatesbacteria bacterium]